MKTKTQYISLFIALIFLAMPALLHAQPGFGDGDVVDTPIDGGLTLLVAAGIGYGAKKLKDNRMKNK